MKKIIKIIKKIPILRSLGVRAYYSVKNMFFTGSKDYWERRYASGGNSGPGSYGTDAKFKANIINSFVKEHNINSVIDFGCGDGNQLSLAEYPNYIGLDVSKTAIDLCELKFKNDKSKKFFLYDPKTFDGGELNAELGLSLDVIFHLIENDIFENYMKHLFSASRQYVIIYSSNINLKQTAHVKQRKFSTWIDSNLPNWELLKVIINKDKEDSISDFYIYKKVSTK